MTAAEPDFLTLTGQALSIVQGLIVSAAGVFALLGFNEWRRQLIGKRKVELAEQALISCYEVRDVFRWTRSRGIFRGEGDSREPTGSESDAVKRKRDAYFVPIERMTREKELFAKLNAHRYAFGAYFGTDAMKPFENIVALRQDILVSAQILMDMATDDDGDIRSGDDSTMDLRNTLGCGTRKRPDEIDDKLEAAISEIERLCKPILQVKQ